MSLKTVWGTAFGLRESLVRESLLHHTLRMHPPGLRLACCLNLSAMSSMLDPKLLRQLTALPARQISETWGLTICLSCRNLLPDILPNLAGFLRSRACVPSFAPAGTQANPCCQTGAAFAQAFKKRVLIVIRFDLNI